MKKILFPLFLATVFFFSNSNIYAQSLSTKGQDFWFGYMNNQGSGSTGLRAYISSSSLLPITGTISIPKIGWSQNFTVNPNSTFSIQLNEGDVQPPKSEGKFNAVHITSCDSITVYAQNAHSNSNDATVVYPTETLKDKYMSLNWDQSGFSDGYNRGDEILIVATQDNTQIEITPTTNTNGAILLTFLIQ